MENLLNLPEVQSAAAPLLVGLLVAALCAWKFPHLTGVAAVFGVLTTALLVNGLTLSPLTATRKIILLAAIGGLAGLAFDALRWRAPARPWAFAVVAAGSMIWVTINYLQRQSGADLFLPAVGLSAYAILIVVALERMQGDGLRLGAAGLALAIGTGGAATLGASALLGQIAFGAAAGIGAALLLAVLIARVELGSALTLGAGLFLGLIGGAAVLFASMPWYVLALLGLAPLVPLLLPLQPENRFVKAAGHGFAALVPALIAMYLTWKAAPQSLY